jgi:hypothetical protein
MTSLRVVVLLIFSINSLFSPAFAAPPQPLPQTATSQSQSANPTEARKPNMSDKIDMFIKDIEATHNIYLLAETDVIKLLKDSDVDAVLKAQVARVSDVEYGPSDSLQKLDWSEQRAAVEQRALELTKEIFAQQVIDVNLTLLEILHRFLFNEGESGPLRFLIAEIMNYRFSPDELYRLQKEASYAHQFTQGTLLGFIALSGFALYKGRKSPGQMWTRLVEGFKWMWRPAALEAEAVIPKQTKSAGTTVDDLLLILQRSGLAPKAAKAATSQTGRAIQNLGKMRFFSRMFNMLNPTSAHGLVILSGVAGGSADVGLHALVNALDPESSSNTIIKFDDLRDSFYDPLSAMHLSCMSHDLVERLRTAQPGPLLPWVMEMNSIYTDFEILKRMNNALVDITPLSPLVKLDPSTGQLSFQRQTRNGEITESFICAKLKGENPATLTISLNEVLKDVTDAAPLIKNLATQTAATPVTP